MTAFEQAWELMKDFYYGDKDPFGMAAQQGKQGTRKENYGDSKRGQALLATSEPWFGTNLSTLGREADEKNISEDKLDDYFTDNIAEIETHEATHQAQRPALNLAAKEEQGRRVKEAEGKGVKVIGDNSRRSFGDILSRRDTAKQKDFAVSDRQFEGWDEKGAFSTMFGTSKKNWDGGPAIHFGNKKYPPDMNNRDRRDRYIEDNYPNIVDEQNRRKNLTNEEYFNSDKSPSTYNNYEGYKY